MYTIIYKNVLKSDKKLDDFNKWLQIHWPIQKKWGATSVQVWPLKENNDKTILCSYKVKNLKYWNQKAMAAEASSLIRSLGELVELNQMSIKITASSTN